MEDDTYIIYGATKDVIIYDKLAISSIYIGRIKPILRPLSDLTKEIEHNGERFVFSDRYLSNSKIKMLLDNSLCSFNNPLNDIDYNSVKLLLEHHFDVFGLIEKGLAININSIEGKEVSNG